MSAIVAVPYDSAISKVSKTEEPSLSVTVTLGKKKEAVVKNFRISGLDLADLQLESLHQSAQQVLGVDYPLIMRNVSPDGAKFCLNKQEKLVRALGESEGSLTLLCRRKAGGKSKKQEESYVDWIPIDEEDLSADDDDSEPERLTPPPQAEDAEVEDTQKPRQRGRHHKHCYHDHEECRKQREEGEHGEQEPSAPSGKDEKDAPRRRGRHHAHCHHYHEECRKQREQEESGKSKDASEQSRDEKRAARLQKREAKQEEKEEKRQVREQRKALKEARKEEKQAEKAARKAMKEERKQEKQAARAAAKQESSSSSEESGSSSDEGEQQKPRERFAEHLKVLVAMGFTKEKMNLRLLKRFDGDVTKVAQEIMSKQLKREEKEHKPSAPRRHGRRSQA